MVHIYFNIIVLLAVNIWDINGQESALNITTTNSTTSIKPVTNHSYQTKGFNTNNVRSGPILLIDKKTLFISDLHYDGSYSGAHFWAGTGSPSSTGTLVPDENNTTGILEAYSGQNIYLQLPGNLTLDKIDYLGIWSIDTKSDISHVNLYPNASDEIRGSIPEALGFHQTTQDNKTIFRVPKCCAFNKMFYTSAGCQPSNAPQKIEYTVFASNETHIDPDQNMTNIEFIPYHRSLKCRENQLKVPVGGFGPFGFIFNSSVIYTMPDKSGILGHGEYCAENSNSSDTPLVIICINSPATEAGMPNLYFPILIISMICFLLSALCYLFILKATDLHRKCFIGYSSSMTVTFFSLILLQKVNTGCLFTGGLFIFSTLCSYVWLSCLCIDLVFIVKPYKRFSDLTRIYYYIGFSLGIPLIFLITSLSDGKADVPKSFIKMYSQGMCSCEDSNIALFFTPIGILIIVSVAALGYTSYLINTHHDNTDYDWVRNKSHYKFILRSCSLVWITSCIWQIEVVVTLRDLTSGLKFALDLIEASQGIFVVFIFVLNKYTRREISRTLEREKNKQEQEMQYRDLMKRLNNSNSNNCPCESARAENEHG